MPKRKPGPKAHQILFAGDEAGVVLLNKKRVRVFVRELPARYHPLVFRCADRAADLVELCTYVRQGESWSGDDSGTELLDPAFQEVLPASGYVPVPAGWADNLQQKSLLQLYDLAKKLNFSSAAETGRRLVAAKEWKAPLLLEAEQTVMPFVEKLTTSLISSLTALSTSASATASGSSTKPSPG